MSTQRDSSTVPPRSGRTVMLAFSLVVNVVLLLIIGAIGDPFGISKEPRVIYPAPATASPPPSRPAYQFAPSSDAPIDGSLQCPDAGSVAAGKGDDKTEVLTVVKGASNKPVMLLGPNRRVVVAKGVTMTAPVAMCGDGGTLYIIGPMQGHVVMRGNGVKIVVQDGGKNDLPPAYSTSNGLVLTCTTKAVPNTPHCDSYLPRPGAKPNG